jgi:transcriptional regulator with XRE-family HTH domain
MPRRRRFSEESFGPTIETLMAETGVTYRELGSRTGLSAGYLNHLVHGNRPVPSNDVVRTLAEGLGVEPEHFREFRHRTALRSGNPYHPEAGPLSRTRFPAREVDRAQVRSLRQHSEMSRQSTVL